MKSRRRKMIAPIVVTVLIILYLLFYFFVLIHFVTGIFKYVLGAVLIVPVLILAAMCRERLKEIKGGEEDDLSKY